MREINLDGYQKRIKVQYNGKVYELRKITVLEQDFVAELQEKAKTGDVRAFGQVLDFIIARFKETGQEFNEEEFKKIATFEIVNDIFLALTEIPDKKN